MDLKTYKKWEERQEAIKDLYKTLGHKMEGGDEEIEIPQKTKSKQRIAEEKKLLQTMGHALPENDDEDDEDE
jgi:hypothetical protein